MVTSIVPDNNRPLYFLHIHKTAGVTLHAILDSFFAPEEVLPAIQWHQFFGTRPEQRAQCKLIRGHFHYCVHEVLDRKPVYITMLRDPVSRTISRYFHCKRDVLHYLNPLAHHMTLAEFIRHPITRPQVQNLQTRHIAWDFDIRTLAAQSPETILKPWYLEERINGMLKELPDEADHALLEKAKQRLGEFAWVGLVERFAHSIALLTHTFCWQPLSEIQHLNVAPETLRANEIDRETLAEIKRLTWADQDLYEYGCQLFKKRYAHMLRESSECSSKQAFPCSGRGGFLQYVPGIGPALNALRRITKTTKD
jgi:hypothetical protein